MTAYLQSNKRASQATTTSLRGSFACQPPQVKQQFKPELLNRFDEQVVFQRLSRDHVARIAGLMMSETRGRVEDKGFSLEVGVGLFLFCLGVGSYHGQPFWS